VLTRETKESFKLFDDVFQFFRLAGKNAEDRVSDPKNQEKFKWEELQDLMPLDVTVATDMAADWKLVGAGGGCKNTEMFCTLCTCTSSQVHYPNDEKCCRFCSAHSNDPNWHCYHHPIMSSDTSAEINEEIRRLEQSILSDLEKVERESKIKYYSNTLIRARTKSNMSINFLPRNDDERDAFIDLLMDELILRGLSASGDLEELRQRLLSELVIEKKLRDSLTKLEHCTKLEASIIALLHKIPCTLHAENRIGIKILTMLLMEGFSNAQKGLLFGNKRSEKDRITAYAELIENIFNNVILGDDDGPAQWNVPMDDDGKMVGAITLDNNRIRQVIDNLELLIEASVCDETRKHKYNGCIPQYREAMIIVRQRKEYTDDEIISYQAHVDQWFRLWNELHGAEGCTNYVHMLSLGHLAEYMYKWRNMYRFSQQGWEKFNHVFSTVYFRRTNHGGRRHKDAQKSKLIGIARWLQRRLLWMTGIGDQIITDQYQNPNNDI